jgi:hypothetical protein
MNSNATGAMAGICRPYTAFFAREARLSCQSRTSNVNKTTTVMPVQTGASNRSKGSEPRTGSRSCAERMSTLPGKEVLAMTCPPPVTACEMPELARRKIGMPYSAARTGATRA